MKTAIIDDLTDDRSLMEGYLFRFFRENCENLPCSVNTYASGSQFLETFSRNKYNIIFIDYYMDEMSGYETAQAIRHTDPLVTLIFITGSRDFAVESYKVKASGYLVKPFCYQELVECLNLLNLKDIRDRQYIQITNGRETVKIVLRDIIYCDISGHYTQFHTKSMGLQKSRMPFQNLSAMLEAVPEFLTCYRGCIINMEYIGQITDSTFIMENGERVPYRKKHHNQIMNIYSEFMFRKVRTVDYEF